jgi:hypothetical protein
VQCNPPKRPYAVSGSRSFAVEARGGALVIVAAATAPCVYRRLGELFYGAGVEDG